MPTCENYKPFAGSSIKQIIAWFVGDICHKYHSWYFKIVSNLKLRITISKYHSWYLCQISLQIMLVQKQSSSCHMSCSLPSTMEKRTCSLFNNDQLSSIINMLASLWIKRFFHSRKSEEVLKSWTRNHMSLPLIREKLKRGAIHRMQIWRISRPARV